MLLHSIIIFFLMFLFNVSVPFRTQLFHSSLMPVIVLFRRHRSIFTPITSLFLYFFIAFILLSCSFYFIYFSFNVHLCSEFLYCFCFSPDLIHNVYVYFHIKSRSISLLNDFSHSIFISNFLSCLLNCFTFYYIFHICDTKLCCSISVPYMTFT